MKRTRTICRTAALAGALVLGSSALIVIADPIDELPPSRRGVDRETSRDRESGRERNSARDRETLDTRSDERERRSTTTTRSSQNRGPIGLFLSDDGEYAVRVNDVREGSPADRAGIREGDYVVSVNGRETTELSEAMDALADGGRDNAVEITIERDGRNREFRLRLPQRRETAERSTRGDTYNAEERVADRAERLGERVGRIIERVREVTEELSDDQPAPSVRDRYDRFSEDPQGIDERPRYRADDERLVGQPDRFVERSQRRDSTRNLRANWQEEGTATTRPRQRVRASLGVTLDERENGRLFISRVQPGSAAQRAGLEQGDELLRVDDQRVYSHADVMRSLSEHSPGDEVELKIRRDGRNEFLTARLREGRTADVPPAPRDPERQAERAERRESRRAVLGEAVRGVLEQARDLLEETPQDRDDWQDLREQTREDAETGDEQPDADSIDSAAESTEETTEDSRIDE